jgi:5'-nucleotidase
MASTAAVSAPHPVRVLVTNDDGVSSPGIAALAGALAGAGYDVVVAAPLDDRSGSGAGIGPMHLNEHISVESAVLPDLPGLPAWGVEGPPALAVMAARLGAFGEPPDLVASGINPGCNTGRSVLHSGTVGAALTAANFGISALAVSIDVGDPYHFQTAAALAVDVAGWLAGQPERTVINLNVPNVAREEIRGVRAARLAPFGTVRAAIAEHRRGRLQLEMRATGVELAPDTDTALVKAGFAAVTSLAGIREDTERPNPAGELDGALRAGAGSR